MYLFLLFTSLYLTLFSKFIRILMILCISFSLSTLIVIPLQTASDRKPT